MDVSVIIAVAATVLGLAISAILGVDNARDRAVSHGVGIFDRAYSERSLVYTLLTVGFITAVISVFVANEEAERMAAWGVLGAVVGYCIARLQR